MKWAGGYRLKSMSSSKNKLSFTYDDSGIRISKVVMENEPGGNLKTYGSVEVIDYTTIEGRITSETKNSSSTTYYRYDKNGSPVALNYGGKEYFYLKNLQGDIVEILDITGTSVVQYSYDSWGVLLSTTGTLAGTLGEENHLRYRGYFYDTETALFYVNSRYYNPEIGRWISADKPDYLGLSAVHLLETNLFAYCGNNPIMYIDPTGHIEFHWKWWGLEVSLNGKETNQLAMGTAIFNYAFGVAAGIANGIAGIIFSGFATYRSVILTKYNMNNKGIYLDFDWWILASIIRSPIKAIPAIALEVPIRKK